MPPMPANFDVVPVRGRFVSFDGAALQGRVVFTPSVPYLTSPSTKSVILSKPIVGTVVDGVLRNATGNGDLYLFATDDPDVDRSGWTYSVKEDVGGVGRPAYNISVPLAAGTQGLDLYALATDAPEVTPGDTYILAPAFYELSARVSELENSGVGGTGGLTSEQVRDLIGSTLVAGTGVTKVVDDAGDTVTISATGGGGAVSSVNTKTGAVVLSAADVGAQPAGSYATSAQLTAASTDDRNRANHTGTQTSASISDFAEAAQDAVASLLAAGTNVTVSYDDVNNRLTITSAGTGGSTFDAESARDALGTALVGVGNITIAVNDAADTITISTTATANATDAALRDRSTHTGTQPASSISGLSAVATSGSFTDLINLPVTLRVIIYANSAYPARPAGLVGGQARYIGPVQPTDWLANDEWINTSSNF